MIPSGENENFLLYEIKADKMPVSIYVRMDRFITREFEYKKGDMLYLFSDGFPDQFGGPKGKKFKYKPFKKMFLNNASESMAKQKSIIEETFLSWKGDLEQVDDIVIIGIKL
jgi:serine phosphatase RsbU (regulator of sigma subunit)